jgi:hypothetical protein
MYTPTGFVLVAVFLAFYTWMTVRQLRGKHRLLVIAVLVSIASMMFFISLNTLSPGGSESRSGARALVSRIGLPVSLVILLVTGIPLIIKTWGHHDDL